MLLVDATDGHHGVFADVAIRLCRRPPGHAYRSPEASTIPGCSQACNGRRRVDGLLDARRQTVVHFGDERADAAGVAGPFVGADLGKVGGGGVVDDVGIKAGVGAVVSKYI